MAILNSTIRFFSKNRLQQIDNMRLRGVDTQHIQLESLLHSNGDCTYLREQGAKLGTSTTTMRGGELYSSFAKQVPVVGYDELKPYVERVLQGEKGVLTSESVQWMAKSSGTTAGKSKFIPITHNALHKCHYRGGRDVMVVYCDNHPSSLAFNGKALTLGGSARIDETSGISCGDLSAIMIANTPLWVNAIRYPKSDIALIADFQKKVEAICNCAIGQNVTSFAGVPSWNMVLMNKILDHTGAKHIHEVWPEMSLFIHGGVGFKPYREPFSKLFPDPQMTYMETYNASEGFFALQDDPTSEDMLLMLDYGVFYEFIETSYLHSASPSIAEHVVPLSGVVSGVNYAMIITTNGGLWRYMIGDTVSFTSTNPYKIKITGRTKQYINAFGEEVIVDNAEGALHAACTTCGATVAEYTVAPVFMEGRAKGCHQWLIEFSIMPPCGVEAFVSALDSELCTLNSDYGAKRDNNSTLTAPTITVAPVGTFMRWFDIRGKVGGQNKVPRLSNDRAYIDELLAIM